MRSKSIKKVIASALAVVMGVTMIAPAPAADAAKTAKTLKAKKKKITLYAKAPKALSQKKIKLTIKPKNAKVTYKINKKKVAKVSKKGVVTAKKVGKAKITVKSGKKKVTVNVIVKKYVPVKTVTVEQSSVTLKKGDTSQIKAAVSPKKVTNKTLTYASDKEDVAKVSKKGVITAVATGSAMITVKAKYGKSNAKTTVAVTVTGGAVTATTPAVTATPPATKAPATNAPATDVPATNAPASNAPSAKPTDKPSAKPTDAPTEAPTEAPATMAPAVVTDAPKVDVTIGGETITVDENTSTALSELATKLEGKKTEEIVSNFASEAGEKKVAENVTVVKEAGSDTAKVSIVNVVDGTESTDVIDVKVEEGGKVTLKNEDETKANGNAEFVFNNESKEIKGLVVEDKDGKKVELGDFTDVVVTEDSLTMKQGDATVSYTVKDGKASLDVEGLPQDKMDALGFALAAKNAQ